MSPKATCFVAYPSKPPSLAETLDAAIDRIKQGQVVAIDSWTSTSVAGKFIITTICQAIGERDLFICDLTHLNHNVLFELGYAIARKKRVWILLDLNIKTSKLDYEKFKLLTTVGYSSYSNSHDIENALYQDEPYKDLESTIYKTAIESVIDTREKSTLLYLKSGVETEASVKLSRRVDRSPIPSILDDPKEVRIQPLSWYAQRVYGAYAVIAHSLSPEHAESRFLNAKNSLVSGLAYGFGKPLLMLAHEPYESPIDYRDLLQTHRTGAQCERLAGNWLEPLETKYTEHTLAARNYEDEHRAYTELRTITIGDPIAENESEELPNYFIRTAAYTEALGSRNTIFVGRKGSGKTAILYKLTDDLRSDPRNHVCIIKPVSYELEGILHMLGQTIQKAEKGYLIEGFWKFLIYTELAKSVYEAIKSKPPYYEPDDSEKQLVELVDDNAAIITSDFSIRLESVVARLQDLSASRTAESQRLKISEMLHEEVIARLRSTLGNVLKNKNKVVILVDNLDKAWNPRSDLSRLGDLLFGLLGVSHRISRDFQKADHWRRPVNLSLIIFLRSDIFVQVIKYARERDKVSYSRIAWEDRDLLLRVLEERFLVSSGSVRKPEEVWLRYFCPGVKGIATREYITSCILPRPRDLLYLAKAAMAQAVNRRHSRVEEADILEAERKYSQYALDSLTVENGIQLEALESLLYEFVGSTVVIDRGDILRAMGTCNIAPERLDDVIELLCNLTFLGREVERNRFEFLYNEEDKGKLQVMARKTAAERVDKLERFRIHEAFHGYLEIVPGSRSDGGAG